jgi:hypothetical protein
VSRFQKFSYPVDCPYSSRHDASLVSNEMTRPKDRLMSLFRLRPIHSPAHQCSGLVVTGGRPGGHHSFEDFHQPILATYSSIRHHDNNASQARKCRRGRAPACQHASHPPFRLPTFLPSRQSESLGACCARAIRSLRFSQHFFSVVASRTRTPSR